MLKLPALQVAVSHPTWAGGCGADLKSSTHAASKQACFWTERCLALEENKRIKLLNLWMEHNPTCSRLWLQWCSYIKPWNRGPHSSMVYQGLEFGQSDRVCSLPGSRSRDESSAARIQLHSLGTESAPKKGWTRLELFLKSKWRNQFLFRNWFSDLFFFEICTIHT